jgi:transposase
VDGSSIRRASAEDVGATERCHMQTVTTIGLDIAKSVFQLHGVDAAWQVAIRRQLKRRYVLSLFAKLPPCLVGIEACASSHHWARAPGAWPYSAPDAAGLREALTSNGEERRA